MNQAQAKAERRKSEAEFRADVFRILAEQRKVIGALSHSVTQLQREVAELTLRQQPVYAFGAGR